MKIGRDVRRRVAHASSDRASRLNVELRDIDGAAQSVRPRRERRRDGGHTNDLTWTHTFMVGANLVLFLPVSAKISP